MNILRWWINSGTSTPPIPPSTPVILTGYLIGDGGSEITERGFNYGPTSDLGSNIVSTDITQEFTATVDAASGSFYYQSYATNAYGTNSSDILVITI